jgi:hypothetical protein
LRNLDQRIKCYRQKQAERQAKEEALRELQPLDENGGVAEEFVKHLAQLHFDADRGIEQIVWFKDGHGKEIRLIEVIRTALPSEKVHVFRFASSAEVSLPLCIADVRPSEWDRIKSGDMPLPEGWDLGTAQVFRRYEDPCEGGESQTGKFMRCLPKMGMPSVTGSITCK